MYYGKWPGHHIPGSKNPFTGGHVVLVHYQQALCSTLQVRGGENEFVLWALADRDHNGIGREQLIIFLITNYLPLFIQNFLIKSWKNLNPFSDSRLV